MDKLFITGGNRLQGEIRISGAKKVLWNMETEKFESIKESLDDYLQSWRKFRQNPV